MLLKRIKIDIENIASVDQPVDCLTTKKKLKIFFGSESLIPLGFRVFLYNQIRN